MRLVRSLKRSTEGDEVSEWWHLYASSRRADDDGSRTAPGELLLDRHLDRVKSWAELIAKHLHLPDAQRNALTIAGGSHDLGKDRRVWQRSIKRFSAPPLAKGPMQPNLLGNYRHELGSLYDITNRGILSDLMEEERDLAMHVVAAHHGRARPHFSQAESYDPEHRDDEVGALVDEVPLRFDRLQRRYGRWGLAWLESILRAADILGSEDEEDAR
jgi:CRISPR-associated endonuclease/helicase Cas3